MMNELQKFESDHREKLIAFLDEYNPGHDDIQLQHFIIDKNGVTDFGKYRQCLAEIHSNYSALQDSYIVKRKTEAEIGILEAEKIMLAPKDDPVSKATMKLKDAEIEQKQITLHNLIKTIRRNMNELTKMFEMATAFERSIKDQDRQQLEIEFWQNKLAKMLEINILWQGGNLSGVMETIDSLPPEIKAPLVAKMHELRVIAQHNHNTYLLEADKRSTKELPNAN